MIYIIKNNLYKIDLISFDFPHRFSTIQLMVQYFSEIWKFIYFIQLQANCHFLEDLSPQ